MAAPWQHAAVWRSIGTCMTTQRRSYETGHKPKCLVIVDDTAEWDRAVYYASRWAIRVGGGVVMLRVIETEDQNQQWLGVADIMRAEAHEAANEALDRAAGRANGIAAITPERVIREGDPTDQLLDVIDKDVDIAMLVLAANPGPEGPGPIITMMASVVGTFPRSEEHTSELQSRLHLVCRLLLEKKKKKTLFTLNYKKPKNKKNIKQYEKK